MLLSLIDCDIAEYVVKKEKERNRGRRKQKERKEKRVGKNYVKTCISHFGFVSNIDRRNG
jgi:hypothetical protein